MAIVHKFLNYYLWNNGFYTIDSILNPPYEPEVIVIGSFNHGWPWNQSDFFYGRDMYMWPIMANLFIHNSNLLIKRRTAQNNVPTLQDIFGICTTAKLCFADIVRGTKPHITTLIQGNSVTVNNQFEWNDYKDESIEYLAGQNWLDDNVSQIIDYISRKSSIKQICFTFKSGTWLSAKAEVISNAFPRIPSIAIFTPTGNGFGKNLNPPFHERAWSICHSWIWNGLQHLNVQIAKPGYGCLDHVWLASNGVNVNNF